MVKKKELTVAGIDLRFSGRPGRTVVAVLTVPASTSSSQCLRLLIDLIPWCLYSLSDCLSIYSYCPLRKTAQTLYVTVKRSEFQLDVRDDPGFVCGSECGSADGRRLLFGGFSCETDNI